MEQLMSRVQALIDGLDRDTDDRAMQIVHGARDDLNGYSILANIDIQEKRNLVEQARHHLFLERAMGSMVGMAIGDALGHPFEFMPTQDQPGRSRFDLASMTFLNESNAFGLDRGQWTDDASMGLCMADSCIMRRKFDGSDMRVRFWCWWNRGYDNAFRKDPRRSGSVGLGGNISKSLTSLTPYSGREKMVPPKYEAATEDAGNGSLMRFTPVALYYHAAELDEVYHYSRESSYTTHPGIIAAEACSLLGHLIVRALNRPAGELDVKAWLEAEVQIYLVRSGLTDEQGNVLRKGWGYDEMYWLCTGQPARPTERCWAWKTDSLDIASTLRARGRSYNGYPVSAGYFGSYSMDGLAMALWCVYHTTSFDEAVTRSVNLLGDADSHGSITGQLAGALYGYNTLNRQFIDWLVKWDDNDFAVRALMLTHLGSQRMQESPEAAEESQPTLGRTTSDQCSPPSDPEQPPLISRVISAPPTGSAASGSPHDVR
jgi:ADP-ribosyl-[dinitrogen reductase] hydrolase